MKTILLAAFIISTGLLSAATALPTFLVRCTNLQCPIERKQELQAKKIQIIGSTTTGAGTLVDRTIIFKCFKCGKFTTQDRVLVPVVEPPVEVKKRTITKARKSRVMQLPPMPPVPIKRTRLTMSNVVQVKTPVTLSSFHKPNQEVFYGPLPKDGPSRLFKPVSHLNPLMLGFTFTGNQPVELGWQIVVCDVLDFVITKPAGFGAKLEYSDDLVTWNALAGWGSYPEDQEKGLTWAVPVGQNYSKLFFRAYKY